MAINYDNIIIESGDKQISVKKIKDQIDKAGIKSGKAYVVLDQEKVFCEDGKSKTVKINLVADRKR